MIEAGLVISHLFGRPTECVRRLAEGAALWSFRRLPEPDWLAGRPRRRIFHWGLGAALADFQRQFLAEGLDRYLAESEAELFSFDLGPSARRHLGILPLSKPLGREAIFRETEKNIRFIRKFYKGPLAVENYNYYPTGLYEHITEPEFIQKYLAEFGLKLVLDLAHGAVTAHNRGLTPLEYFASLPLEQVAEIHVSRPFLPPSPKLWAADTHLGPQEREWGWLSELLRNSRLSAPVFIEYYKNAAVLSRLQAHLTEILQSDRQHPEEF